MKTTLSLRQARRLALCAQGLTRAQPFGAGKNAVVRCLQQLGYVQIDTISVIERAHHHTLWSRVPSYRPQLLDTLQARERRIFEYWYHAAAYLPMQDYRFCLPRMRAIAAGEKHWHQPDKKLMRYALDRVKAEGPLMARDFARPENRKPGAWWEWKPAKQALEQLFIQGELMVARRENFHKVYDLPERVLPPNVETTEPSQAEFCRFLILRAIRAHGVVTAAEMSYLRKGIKPAIRAQLVKLLGEGEVVEVAVAKLDTPYFTTPERIARLGDIRVEKRVRLLSPFDNAVIQRKRLPALFGFDYQVECYVPPAKRNYGYFCLPVLYGDQFVGRLDPKADRKTGVFLVRSVHLEKPVADREKFAAALAAKLNELARFNGCDRVKIERADAAAPVAATLRDALAGS